MLLDGAGAERAPRAVRDRLATLEGSTLFAWLEVDGAPLIRGGADGPASPHAWAIVERDGIRLRFRPGAAVTDRRGGSWDVDGDHDALFATVSGHGFDSATYPDALARLWAALTAPHAAES